MRDDQGGPDPKAGSPDRKTRVNSHDIKPAIGRLDGTDDVTTTKKGR
jgi:hypothetical protein